MENVLALNVITFVDLLNAKLCTHYAAGFPCNIIDMNMKYNLYKLQNNANELFLTSDSGCYKYKQMRTARMRLKYCA